MPAIPANKPGTYTYIYITPLPCSLRFFSTGELAVNVPSLHGVAYVCLIRGRMVEVGRYAQNYRRGGTY